MTRVLLFATLLAHLPVASEASDTAEHVELKFHQAIGTGDAETTLRLLHPSVRELVDPPVLAAWTSAVREKLGAHVSTSHTSRTQSQKLTGTSVVFEADVTFENGTARSSVTVIDGVIVAFQIQSDLLQNWFQGPATTDLYERQAEAFIEAFLTGEDKTVWAMIHPALQEAVGQDKLRGMMESVSRSGGALRKQHLRGQRFSLDGTSPALFLTVDLECERARGECEIEFQFEGMKGHLLGFRFR